MGAFLYWGDEDISSLSFDAVTSESHNKSNTITEHPIEAGADITDHVRPNLDRVILECFISNTPVYSNVGLQNQIPLYVPDPPTPITLNGAINVIGDALSSLINPKNQIVANVFTFDNAPDFVAQALQVLETLRTQGTLVNVVCPSYVYNNMLIEEFECNRDPGTGTGASFNITLREIRTVASSIVSAPRPTIPRANIEQNKGKQAGDETPEQKKSALKALVGWASH